MGSIACISESIEKNEDKDIGQSLYDRGNIVINP